MSLWGYFDEAGHPSDPNVHAFVIAGGIAEEADWIRLDQEWSQILEEENVRDSKGVRWCHWKDLRHAQDAFLGWDAERVHSFITRLRTTIQNHVQLVGVQFPPGIHPEGCNPQLLLKRGERVSPLLLCRALYRRICTVLPGGTVKTVG